MVFGLEFRTSPAPLTILGQNSFTDLNDKDIQWCIPYFLI